MSRLKGLELCMCFLVWNCFPITCNPVWGCFFTMVCFKSITNEWITMYLYLFCSPKRSPAGCEYTMIIQNTPYLFHVEGMNLAQRCATGQAEWRIIGKMTPQTCWWSWWFICGQPSTSPQFGDGYSCRYRTYQHAHAVFVQSNNQPLANRSICHLRKYLYFLFGFVSIEQFVHYGLRMMFHIIFIF